MGLTVEGSVADLLPNGGVFGDDFCISSLVCFANLEIPGGAGREGTLAGGDEREGTVAGGIGREGILMD